MSSDPTIADAIIIAARVGALRAKMRTRKGIFRRESSALADHESARVTAILSKLFPPKPQEDAW